MIATIRQNSSVMELCQHRRLYEDIAESLSECNARNIRDEATRLKEDAT